MFETLQAPVSMLNFKGHDGTIGKTLKKAWLVSKRKPRLSKKNMAVWTG